MSKLQKTKKPKAKQTQKQKQAQNVVVNINKPTRARKSRLEKESSPKEKKMPHPPPQFSFSPVISMSTPQDNSITRHILKTQDAFSNELKKYALANSQADEIDALKKRFDKLTTGASSPIVFSDFQTRGASTRFVGDNLDDVKFAIDSRLKTSDYKVLEPTPSQGTTFQETKPFTLASGMSERLQETQAATKRLQTVLRSQSSDSVLRPAGNLGRGEDTPSRLKANLEHLYEEDAAIGAAESGGGDVAFAEAGLALQLMTQALGVSRSEIPSKEKHSVFAPRFAEAITETTARAEEQGAPAENLTAESGARHGTQQQGNLLAELAGDSQREKLRAFASRNGISTRTTQSMSVASIKAALFKKGVDVPIEILELPTSTKGRKPATKEPLGTAITAL